MKQKQQYNTSEAKAAAQKECFAGPLQQNLNDLLLNFCCYFTCNSLTLCYLLDDQECFIVSRTSPALLLMSVNYNVKIFS